MHLREIDRNLPSSLIQAHISKNLSLFAKKMGEKIASLKRGNGCFLMQETDYVGREDCQRQRGASYAAQTLSAKVCWAAGVGPWKSRGSSLANSPIGLRTV